MRRPRRTPITSLEGKTIKYVKMDPVQGIKIIDDRNKVIATLSPQWTLYDKNGNLFEDDARG